MAGKRKAEGIALLSVYADGDDDDDATSESSGGEDESGKLVRDGEVVSEEKVVDAERPSENEWTGFQHESPSGTHVSTPEKEPTPQPERVVEGPTAAEPGETTSLQNEPSREAEDAHVSESAPMELDLLNDFLPPAPTAKYSEELQTKFAKFLRWKKTGISLNEQLRNTKGYRNPDFLQHAVRYHNIDQIGTMLKKEVFDPHGFDQSDYYDAIALEQRREVERKDQERKQNQRVDFVRSSIQGAVATSKPSMSMVHKVRSTASGKRNPAMGAPLDENWAVVTISTSESTTKIDGRIGKKSKWDKVELESRTAQSISSAVDAIAAANVHAALLSASTNAGAGYASFAQQRRREAEEKLRARGKSALSNSGSKSERKTDKS